MCMELRFRQFYISDAAAIVAIVGDERFSRDTIQLPDPYTIDHAVEWIERISKNIMDYHVLAILNENNVIGQVSLTRHDKTSGFVGCWISPDYWGNGIATSAFQKIIRDGFYLGYKEIFGGASDGNIASSRAMQKAGMVETYSYYEIPFKDHTRELHKHVIKAP